MPSPFPGMDPYLEYPALWPSVHTQLITYTAAQLQPLLVPRYVARPESRVLLGGADAALLPDISIRAERLGLGGIAVLEAPAGIDVASPEIIEAPELTIPHRFVQIWDVSHHEVVTVIEFLSPWNKSSDGRKRYRERQDEIMMTETNLVEIDLLRGGSHVLAVPAYRLSPSDYRVCTHRAMRSQFEVVRFGLRDPLPKLRIPLRQPDPDVVLDLAAVMDRCYEDGAYAYDVDYAQPPEPPLSTGDAEWARQLIASRPPITSRVS